MEERLCPGRGPRRLRWIRTASGPGEVHSKQLLSNWSTIRPVPQSGAATDVLPRGAPASESASLVEFDTEKGFTEQHSSSRCKVARVTSPRVPWRGLDAWTKADASRWLCFRKTLPKGSLNAGHSGTVISPSTRTPRPSHQGQSLHPLPSMSQTWRSLPEAKCEGRGTISGWQEGALAWACHPRVLPRGADGHRRRPSAQLSYARAICQWV